MKVREKKRHRYAMETQVHRDYVKLVAIFLPKSSYVAFVVRSAIVRANLLADAARASGLGHDGGEEVCGENAAERLGGAGRIWEAFSLRKSSYPRGRKGGRRRTYIETVKFLGREEMKSAPDSYSARGRRHFSVQDDARARCYRTLGTGQIRSC